jgi:hypothetical protein
MVGALTNESATSKVVYFAHCNSEMIYITHLHAEQPERLAGPLLADTYVTLLKGHNAWYGEKLAKGELKNGGQHQWQGYDSGEWHSHLLLIESNDVVDLYMLGFFFSFYEVGVVNSTNCEHFPIFTPYKSFELVWIALSARLSTGSFVIP